jgi:hypothetical protein
MTVDAFGYITMFALKSSIIILEQSTSIFSTIFLIWIKMIY